MLIKQFIEFESRKTWIRGRMCASTTGYFHDKTKISMADLRVNYFLLSKYCRRQCTLLPLYLGLITENFNPKPQDFKRVLDLNCK